NASIGLRTQSARSTFGTSWRVGGKKGHLPCLNESLFAGSFWGDAFSSFGKEAAGVPLPEAPSNKTASRLTASRRIASMRSTRQEGLLERAPRANGAGWEPPSATPILALLRHPVKRGHRFGPAEQHAGVALRDLRIERRAEREFAAAAVREFERGI